MKHRIAGSMLACAALLTTSARGDEAGEREARALFAEGNQSFQTGDYGVALERYRAAYTRWSNPKILLNIGTTLRQLGRDAEAAETYASYLRDLGADPARRAEVEKSLAELDTRLGKLTVVVDDRKAVVRVDDTSAGRMGGVVELRLPPGLHVVVAERDGAPLARAEVSVIVGKTVQVSLRINVPAVPSSPTSPSPPVPASAPAPTKAAPAGQPKIDAHDTMNSPPPSLSHRGQFGLIARADFSPQPPGGVMSALGLGFGLGDHVEINTCALLGRSKGLEPGATVFVLKGAWKPRFSVGAPVFFNDGARVGMHVSAGVEWDPIRYFGVFADAGVAVFPNAPDGYQKVVFVPSIGVEPRL